ncbi:MAG: BON domain-containing protein [Gammaproteobacteria bacterium]
MDHRLRIVHRMWLPVVLLFAGLTLGACSSNQPMAGARVGSFMDDSYLTSTVKAKLLDNTGLKSFHIHVRTSRQVVTLSGTLPSAALRAEAVRTAQSVGGVKSVVDDLEVGSGR